MDEKSICANIEKLVKLLNAELNAAHELGLRIHLYSNSLSLSAAIPKISVAIWREVLTVPARTPIADLDAYGPELLTGRGKATTETKK